jgi:probable F420-dependent oxidoreductase
MSERGKRAEGDLGVGVVFPQTEIEPDAGAIRVYVEAVEGLGFDHVLVYDHVTGVDPTTYPDWADTAHRNGATSAKPYDVSDRFHEIMVLFGFLAGVCSLELVSGVLVLPQRQTALVAKQAAEVDVLTGGRLRLGVGIGWNPIEYRSMGYDFHERGRRIERQIELLRRYWTEATVLLQDGDDWAHGVGIAPRPVQQPIPIWIGAGANERALARVGRLGDGWLPVSVNPSELAPALEAIWVAAREAGRDPARIGIQGRIEGAGSDDIDAVASEVASWQKLGATHVALNTMRCGLSGVEQHVAALTRVAAAVFEPTV